MTKTPKACEYCQRCFTRDGIKHTSEGWVPFVTPMGWTASRMIQERIPRVPNPVGFYQATHFLCGSCDTAMEALQDYLLGLKP